MAEALEEVLINHICLQKSRGNGSGALADILARRLLAADQIANATDEPLEVLLDLGHAAARGRREVEGDESIHSCLIPPK